MSAPRWTGAGVMWIEAENARMRERPTGVPLTADNVADAQECRDDGGTGRKWTRGTWSWVCSLGRGECQDVQMVACAPRYGTVVTKWREP